MSTISSFKDTENQHDVDGGKDCMNKFCKCLKKHTRKKISFKKKKMKLLTNEQQESYENRKICHICKDKFEDKYTRIKNIIKSEITDIIIQMNIEALQIEYVI